MTDSDEVKLLPCPFCGSADARFDQIEFQVVCRNIDCAAHPHMFDTKTEAAAAWNTRPPAVTDEVVERLRSDCAFLLACIDQSNEAGAPVDESDPEDIATIDQIRKTIASMPAVVSGSQSLGDHALPPSGLSQSSLSQAKPAAAIARRK